jgi:hypothetical protein
MGVVFAKTPKGQAEITQKSGGLTPRQRRVLIMIDGKRTVEELRDMLQSDDLQHTLGMLEEEAYIGIASVQDASGTRHSLTEPLQPITAFRTLPGTTDPIKLQQARNFMNNTLNAFAGTLGNSSLLNRIEQASGHDDLRALHDEWYHALVMSRDGKREAEALRAKLLLVI